MRFPAAILFVALALGLTSCKFTHGGRGTRNCVVDSAPVPQPVGVESAERIDPAEPAATGN